MSAALETRAEIVKLARLLRRQPEELGYLEALAPEPLGRLREQVTEALFRADRGPLARIAKAAAVPPPPMVAALAEHVLGPLLSARVAAFLEPGRAIDLARRLPPTFLADVAVELDPRDVSEIVGRTAPDRIAAVAAELAARRQFVAMGRFVGHLSPEALRQAIEAIDDEAVLRTAFVLEGKERLDDVVAALPPERLQGVIRVAAAAELWPEAVDLLDHLRPARRGAVANLAASEDDAVLDSMLRAAHDQGLWDAVLPIADEMSEEALGRFAELPSIHDGEVLDELVAVSARRGLWPKLEPLVPLLPPAARERVASAAARTDRSGAPPAQGRDGQP